MAELVDAPSSGGGGGNPVEVRVLFWAPFFQTLLFAGASQSVGFLLFSSKFWLWVFATVRWNLGAFWGLSGGSGPQIEQIQRQK